jgi:hypothetical protein
MEAELTQYIAGSSLTHDAEHRTSIHKVAQGLHGMV